MTGKFSIEEMSKYLDEIFPQIWGRYRILNLGKTSSEVQLVAVESNLRPGNTISGPTIFELADISFYIAVMSRTGAGPSAVTSNVSINFLRKTRLNDLIAISKIKKMGRQLIVGDVEVVSEDRSKTIAHAIFTYSVPTA